MALVYGVEGVTAARVWQWDERVAVGVRGRSSSGAYDLLQRVEAAVAGVREPQEQWDFGLLSE